MFSHFYSSFCHFHWNSVIIESYSAETQNQPGFSSEIYKGISHHSSTICIYFQMFSNANVCVKREFLCRPRRKTKSISTRTASPRAPHSWPGWLSLCATSSMTDWRTILPGLRFRSNITKFDTNLHSYWGKFDIVLLILMKTCHWELRFFYIRDE